MPQGAEPPNVLNISSIPWVDFTGFHLHLTTDHLLPILTIGRHTEQNGTTVMPLAIQVHHAVCDGYHLGQFVEQLQSIASSAPDWLVG
jgi:chloramphenicol O-acetyltransferase type A